MTQYGGRRPTYATTSRWSQTRHLRHRRGPRSPPRHRDAMPVAMVSLVLPRRIVCLSYAVLTDEHVNVTTRYIQHTHTHPFNGPFSGTTRAICKSAPHSRQMTMPVPHHSSFLQAGCPSCRPTNSVKALKTNQVYTNIILITTKPCLPRRVSLYQRPSSEEVVRFFFRFLPQ